MHCDGLLFNVWLVSGEPLTVSMSDEFRNILLPNSVEDIEEILAVRQFSFGKFVRQEDHHLRLVFHSRENTFDGELFVVWDRNTSDRRGLQQLFLAFDDLAEEISVQHGVRRHLILHLESH